MSKSPIQRMAWSLDERMFLNLGEVQRLLAAVRAEGTASEIPEAGRVVDQLIIECLIWSGVQSSEFCRLTLADTIVGTGRPSLMVVGKRERPREVFVPAHVNALIHLYVEKVRPRRLPADWRADDPDKPLVLNERRRPLERPALYRRVTSILKRHGFGDRASVQLLRHTYGYLAYRLSGSNLLFVQRQLGHAHPMVTAVYAAFVEENYADLANDLVDRFEQSALRTADNEKA